MPRSTAGSSVTPRSKPVGATRRHRGEPLRAGPENSTDDGRVGPGGDGLGRRPDPDPLDPEAERGVIPPALGGIAPGSRVAIALDGQAMEPARESEWRRLPGCLLLRADLPPRQLTPV